MFRNSGVAMPRLNGWVRAGLLVCVAGISHSTVAAEPREVDASRVDQNRADQSPGRIDQNRVDPARADDSRADESRVSTRTAEQPGERENVRRDDPMARNNLERDDTSDGVYPLEVDYAAALARCERLSDPARAQCIAATNAKFGEM